MKSLFKSYHIVTITFLAITCFAYAKDFHVSTTGNDDNNGKLKAPWETIQHGVENISPGDTLLIHEGTYSESIYLENSGSKKNGYITIRNYKNERVILDGKSIDCSKEDFNTLIYASSIEYVRIQGLTLCNLQTDIKNTVICGIMIEGDSTYIELKDLEVFDIKHLGTSKHGTDAHAIAFYGDGTGKGMSNISIENCSIHDCVLGSSEALVLNGNVQDFSVKNNKVYNCNNIGIDLIGGEGVWEGDSSLDSARNGVVSGNTVYQICAYENPAYGHQYAAGGIYVDGGKDILIEGNVIHHCDIGIEIGCENKGRTTEKINIINNLLYQNYMTGIAFGGYNKNLGTVKNCLFKGNSLFYNNSKYKDPEYQGMGEVLITKSSNNQFTENKLVCFPDNSVMINNEFPISHSYKNTFSKNQYYTSEGVDSLFFLWNKEEYHGLQAFIKGTGQDRDSIFLKNLKKEASQYLN